MIYRDKIEKLLPFVQRPARYIGNEVNSVHKDFNKVDTTMALAFPDIYDIAMSHPGFQILYNIVNSQDNALAARVFEPYVDMEKLMKENNIPLFTLEEHRAVNEYDFLGFTLQYELSYSGVLNMIKLANIPLLSKDRCVKDPFVITGGPCAYNPEPIADFLDIVVLGEGEEVLVEILNAHSEWKKQGASRVEFLQTIASFKGVYIPAFYEFSYHNDGTIKEVKVLNKAAPEVVEKRIISDMDKIAYPLKPIVPFIEVPHERVVLELFRGCLRGCRFCQAGFVYRPVRERSVETLKQQVKQLIKNTGYDEVSLMSLSSSDYTCIHELIKDLNEILIPEKVSISLPSLRVDNYDIELAKEVQRVRRSGLTLAPEAGTQRLRDVINKQVTENDLYTTVAKAIEAGWKRAKLYFMIGLPTEQEEDLNGIYNMALNTAKLGKHGPINVTVSAAGFVPKPYTPFQWVAQNTVEQLQEKQQHILSSFKRHRYIKFNYHDAITSFLEAVLARGDRRVGKVIATAINNGAKLDSWDEHFDWNIWLNAFNECNVDPAFYANREREFSEILPWDHLSCGVNKEHLWSEYQQALKATVTPDCRHDVCTDCGVCPNLKTSVMLTKGE
ncbi:TIGR03960 family B12-binding radical SAM protein [Clostridium sp. 'deep sea']|uniref:TIGR03960 family B12-binding radical SAM protein n=1 Tax=Clostridium sp. 'deep sea' TaxID=2779445 RepID=UPI0018967A3D|nr:TIGR03960 family B12-binding radical SAM protein [Clostridium sp. 'deep sea']QOR36332.1 TIGR03960 family B12-binding radical SAM protein [Clostridium sp. 'deep sea']